MQAIFIMAVVIKTFSVDLSFNETFYYLRDYNI